jgi:hypothetical protein
VHDKVRALKGVDEWIVEIKLSTKVENGERVIKEVLSSPGLKDDFIGFDKESRRSAEQKKMKDNKEKRRKLGETLVKNDRIDADDFAEEPHGHHAGIHLRFNGKDQIIWTTDEDDTTFIVKVGADPELVNLNERLDPGRPLTKEQLRINPFKGVFPQFCSKDNPAVSGPLRTTDEIIAQRFFKYDLQVRGEKTILDPHIEGHDEPFPPE